MPSGAASVGISMMICSARTIADVCLARVSKSRSPSPTEADDERSHLAPEIHIDRDDEASILFGQALTSAKIDNAAPPRRSHIPRSLGARGVQKGRRNKEAASTIS